MEHYFYIKSGDSEHYVHEMLISQAVIHGSFYNVYM